MIEKLIVFFPLPSQEDFANNRQFITVLVYKSMGKRIYYPCKYMYL